MKRISLFVVLLCFGAYAADTTLNDCIAIIQTNTGTGTGFLIRDQDGLWLYTNEHVVRGGAPKATLLSGQNVIFSDMQIAPDRDAVRFKVEGKCAALSISSKVAQLGDRISVIGNSDGAGVATMASGVVNGVGPIDVEVSADFVPGNSGSPILRDGGDVVAMATYLIKGDGGKDWTKAGTRYAATRRFGIRLDNIKWQAIIPKEYYAAAMQLKDAQTFVSIMEYACFPRPRQITDYGEKTLASVKSQPFSSLLRNVYGSDEKFMRSRDEENRIVNAYNREVNNGVTVMTGGQKNATLERYAKKLTSAKHATNNRFVDAIVARDKALKDAARSIKNRKMSVARMDEIYKSYVDLLELMRKDFEEANKSELVSAGHSGVYKPL